MILQEIPDWVKTYGNFTQIEEDLKDFKWQGPGLYLTNNDTLLATLLPPSDDKNFDPWNKNFHPLCLIRVTVFNCTFEHIIFAQCGEITKDHLGNIPVFDSR